MEKQKIKLDKSSKLVALLYSLLIVVPIYVLLGIAYYLDFLNGFLFLGGFLLVMIISIILSGIFRKNKFKYLTTVFIFILSILIICFEFRLLSYESHTYHAEGYREPIELLEGSGIHLLIVGLHDLHYIEDEYRARDTFEKNGIQVFDLLKIKNRHRYRGKTTEVKNFFGFGKDSFQVMGENVKDYVGEDIPFINEFLSKDNFYGDSAGLALGITALIHQGKLENERSIGVTGTLEPNGDVLEVGGITAKMMISEKNGFPFIIVPTANLEEAEAVKSQEKLTIEILPVRHIDEAVRTIEELN